MKTTTNSFQGVVAAFAVAFAFIAAPLMVSATDFDFDLPGFDTLPDLTTSGLTLTQVECNISLSTYEIVSGGSVTITWDTAGLDDIEINGETVSAESGSITIDNITENTTFELVGSNDNGGSCTASAYLVCLPPAVHPPKCDLDAHPQWIDAGETSTLTWTTENAVSAVLTGTDADYGSVDLNGDLEVGPLHKNAWYMLNVTGENGDEIACKVDVYVHEKDELECTLSAHPDRVYRGDTSVLSWTTNGADRVVFSGTNVAERDVDLNGDFTTEALYSSAWYMITAYDGDDKVVCKEDVHIKTDKPTPPVCPIPDADGRIIFDFTGERLFSAENWNSFETDVQNVDLAAGQYDIRLVSWDGYVNRVNADQPREQYQLVFLDGDTEISRSNAISDLADLVIEATNDEVVNTNFNLASAATGIKAVHAFYPDNSSPNSLYPICAAIDPIEPEPELPSCDFFTADRTNIDLGESVTLSWGTTNVDQVFINNGVGGNLPVDGSIEVVPQDDITYVLTAIGAKDQVVDCHVQIHVDTTPVCPFTPSQDTLVFNFDERLRSDQSLGNSQTNIQATTLAAGLYDISLASFDGYANRVNVIQPNEQWQLQFLADGNEVGISNAISDLEDEVAFAFLQEQVNTKYSLTAAANGVRAVHAAYPNTFSANSVEPICAAVTVVEDPAPSCDLFTANPSTITVGGNATLTWETSNATRVVISNGIGEVTATGTVDVSPLVNTTYELTVFGTDNRSVNCEVPVEVSEDPVPVCKAFTATPGNLPIGGGDVVLDWEVEDATSVTISPTVGSVDLVGSTTVNVTQSTTYTLTAVDANGDEVSCIAPVTVPDPVPFTCEGNVTFGASPNSVRSGNDVTLTWNVTDADTVSISEINATAFSGTEVVNPTSDTTYVLTATKGDETIECPTSVTISTGGGGGGSSSPRCELDISDERISLGEEITLTWDTSRATEVTLVDDLGNVIFTTDDMLSDAKKDFLDGEITLAPTRDTEYTLLAERGSRDRSCRVAVDVEDDLVILETRDQQPLVAGISLTSVPYTGFEAGPFMTFMFYALLVAWAFYITYLIVARRQAAVAAEAESPAVQTMRQAEEVRPDVFVPSVTAPVVEAETVAPTNLPTGTPVVGYEATPVQETNETVTAIEDRAHAQKALLSSDAVRYFVATTEGSVERNEVLDEVIAEAKKAYPLEDGWIVINESRMQNLCEVCKVNAQEAPQTFSPATIVPEGSSSLAEAIVTGNVVAAYEMIGNRPMFALADAAADLDAVYRKRQGEDKLVSELLASETESLTDDQIKNMITALTSALDGTYTDEASAVKMAIMKAVKEVA